jgi:hypothetical protein
MSITVTNNDALLAKAAPESSSETKEVVQESASSESSEETAAASEAADDKEVVEVEAKEGDESDGEEPADEDEPAVEAKPKKVGGVQKKINKLVGKLSAKDQEIEYWKEQALKNASPQAADKADAPQAAVEGKPTADKFETHEEYVEALADWKVEQKLNAHETKQKNDALKQEFSKVKEKYKAEATAYAAENPEFGRVIAECDQALKESGAYLSITVENAILKHGPKLAEALAKDPDELMRICSLSALDAAEAIGEIRAQLKKPQEPAIKKITKAPEPVTPVRGATKGPIKTLEEAAKAGAAEYQRVRMEQMKNKKSSWG